MTGPESDAFFSPSFWSEFAPKLHIGDSNFARSCGMSPVDSDILSRVQEDIFRSGWSHFRPSSWNAEPKALAAAVSDLNAAGLPAPFLFVFDETWLMFAGLRQALSHMLGDDYRMLPDFWAWHVSALDGDSGWAPHRDRGAKSLLSDGKPASMTLWIALSRATPENGCIYLVPADRDPTYGTENEDDHQFALGDIRALPVDAGTVLCWNQAILHWGARASHGEDGPRISVAVEFQRGDVAPFNKPLLPPDVFPDLRGRLTLIAKQLIQYSHMYATTPRVAHFLAHLTSESSAG